MDFLWVLDPGPQSRPGIQALFALALLVLFLGPDLWIHTSAVCSHQMSAQQKSTRLAASTKPQHLRACQTGA